MDTNYWFNRTVIINLVLVFVVIAAGAIVRATGSGMGCPDWPRCFGKLIPPTHIDQISWHPNNAYRQGEMIINDETLLVATQDFKTGSDYSSTNWKPYEKHDYAVFNPLHTWVEFINRLATVVLGFPVMLMLGLSLLSWKKNKINIALSALVVFLIGFQAWLGKLVVDKNLQGTTITYHMIGVFAIIAVLIVIYHINKEKKDTPATDSIFKWMLVASIITTLLMVIIGTQVREEIDLIAKASTDRSTWIAQLSDIFILHRSMVWLVLGVNGYLLYTSIKKHWFVPFMWKIGLIIIIEAIVGIVISYYHVPAVSQPIHLFLAATLFALQLDLYMRVRQGARSLSNT